MINKFFNYSITKTLKLLLNLIKHLSDLIDTWLNIIKSFLDYSPSNQPRFFANFIYTDISNFSRDSPSKQMFRDDIIHSAYHLNDSNTSGGEKSIRIACKLSERDKLRSLFSFVSGIRDYPYSADNIEGKVCILIEEIIQNLAWFGSANYEITNSPGGYNIQKITSLSFFFCGIFYIHLAPRKDAENYGRRYGFGLKRHVWRVDFPKVLGGTSGYKKLLKDLNRFNSLGPVFNPLESNKEKLAPSIDYSLYRKNVKAFEWNKTAVWGWNHRDTTLDDCTEFYLFNRKVRFNRSLAVLREHICDELNIILKRLEIDAKIEVYGIPSSREIDNILTQMNNGDLSLLDALKASTS